MILIIHILRVELFLFGQYSMLFPLFIARKYIKSKSEAKFFSLISIITIGGIALGVAVLIVAISILNGFEKKVSENIINFNAHINISGYGGRILKDYDLVSQKIRTELNDQISSFSPYISKKVIVSKGNYSEGLILNGIDNKFSNSSLNKIIIEGRGKLEHNSNNLIMGRKLVEKLNLKLNDKIVVFALKNDDPPSLNNLPLIEQFYLTGIFESGMAEYDDINAYIDFSKANSFFELNNEVTGYNINITNISKIDSVKNMLTEMLRYPFYVRSYRDINRHIFTWLELQQKPIPIVLGLIIIVAIFNIVGAILMLIIQKTSAIGTLRAMGANSLQIMGIFLIQGVSLAIMGIVIGNIIAFTLSYLQNTFGIISLPAEIYYLSKVPFEINFNIYLLISFVGILISILVSLIPSFIATRIQPITAIKFI